MVKFFTPLAMLVSSQHIFSVHAVNHEQNVDAGFLRGRSLLGHLSRSLVETYRCDLCSDPSNEFDAVPPELAGRIVTLTLLGDQQCGGLYAAALAGGTIQGQNQCNSVKAEFAPVCCNANGDEGDVVTVPGEPNRVTDAPGTQPPTAPPVETPPPTMADFGSSCAAVTNTTGGCGGGDRANGLCADGSCCSQYGWCGKSPAHCQTDPLYLAGLPTDPPVNATTQSTTDGTP